MTEPSTAVISSYTQSDYNGVGVSCNGDTDGWIDLSVSGGVGSHTYAWSNGSSSEDINGIGAGNYIVTANDLNGCITTETVVITESVVLTSSYTQSDYNGFGVSCNGSLNGNINATLNGGTIPYSFDWNNGQYFTEDIDTIGAGIYSILSTDANGCYTSDSIIISEPDTFFSGVLGTSQTICFNTVPNTISTLISPTGGNQPYTYDWFIDDGFGFVSLPNSNLDSYSPSNLFDTTTYRVEYSDDYQCNTFTQFVTVTTLPQVEAGTVISDQFLCYDSLASDLTIDISASGGNGNFDYQWESNSTGTWNAIQGATNLFYSPGFLNTSIMYKLLVTSSHDVNCLTRETPSINITVYDSLQIGIISSDQTICFNTVPDLISLNSIPQGVDGIYSYQWEESTDNLSWSIITGENNDSLQSNLLFATTYFRLVVTSDFGCGSKITNTVKITVHDEFLAGSISDNDTICYLENPNQIGSLIPSSGADNNYIFQWQYNDSNIWNDINGASTNLYQPTGLSDSTDYRLVVSNLFCNEVLFTNTINIIVNPLPEIYPIIGDMSVCSNQSDASYTLFTTPLNYRYEWFTNIGTIVGTNESRNCLINWPSNPGTIADIDVIVSIAETGCNIMTSSTVNISSNEAPNVVDVIFKPSSTILVCNDNSSGIHYQWGYDVIATGVSNELIGDTLQYVQLSSAPDTNIERYWVDTYYNYTNGVSCITRSYYNEPPLPLGVNEINANNFNIFPNPATDILYFNYDSEYEINLKVIDLLGKTIDCTIDYENRSLRFKDVKPSIYMLVVQSNKREFIKKFIIK